MRRIGSVPHREVTEDVVAEAVPSGYGHMSAVNIDADTPTREWDRQEGSFQP